MPLDATVGGPNSNSYATLLEADAYFANRYHVTFWDSLESTDQEKLLITNTALLEWYVKWYGLRVTDTQALAWPRTGTYTELGTEYPSNVIPKEVKVALFELVISSFEEDRTNDTGLEGLTSLQVASLKVSASDSYANTPRKVIPEKIWKILGQLCEIGNSRVIWLKRA